MRATTDVTTWLVAGATAIFLVACGGDGDSSDSGGGAIVGAPGAMPGNPAAMPGTSGDTSGTPTAMPGMGDNTVGAMPGGMGMADDGATGGAAGDGSSGGDGTAMSGDTGMMADGSDMGDDGGNTSTGGMREDLGMGDGTDVITIGDSYMLLLISGVRTYLESISGQNYRNYEFPGTRILDGNIPGQYANAKAENPDIKTVVMTGGGNDVIQDPVMQANCEQLNQACLDHMDRIGDAIEELMMQMVDDGVQDVVVVGYSYMTGADLDASLDHSRERYHETCKSDGSGTIPIRCHFVDPLDLGSPLPISFDGIHPTEAGYETLAQYTWDRMQAEGVRR